MKNIHNSSDKRKHKETKEYSVKSTMYHVEQKSNQQYKIYSKNVKLFKRVYYSVIFI